MPKWYSKEEALQKLQHYCAYQDRCHQEVRQQLRDMNVYPDWREEIIVALIEENFLNEERFARSYVRGKFRMKKWGRVRIKQELRRRNISDYCIRKGLSEIEEAAYSETLNELVEKKGDRTDAANLWAFRNKVAHFVINKGYEPAMVWSAVKEIYPDST
ncbi:MAG: regulatory protein RecX [Phaeodactylibacter sp.]|uniref:regulatory protein RecX n=1 Tax=Phaeodactylibacter sp. TaxID=1940289 RepID=UPI0032EAC16A